MDAPDATSTLPVREKTPLKPLTTFKIGGPARYFCEAGNAGEAREAVEAARRRGAPVFVLGGGSNILVSDRGFDGLVLHPVERGVQLTDESADGVRLRVAAGEPWDDFVALTVARGWWGVENLSHIPGQSGAALVQNIGAYGQQLSDVFESAEIMELATGRTRSLGEADCQLEYRRSIFNSARRREYLILNIKVRLAKIPRPMLSYRDVKVFFDERGAPEPEQADIRGAIIAIRDRKFPYPREERGGNAGSFFKNPALSAEQYEALAQRVQQRFGPAGAARLAEARGRNASGGPVKVPAALLIDLCQLKGATVGGAQVNPSQPLVILNLGGATSDDVFELAGSVRRAVWRETGVALEAEPEFVGFTEQERARFLALD